MFFHVEQRLRRTVSAGLQVKDCCLHGSLMNVLMSLKIGRRARSFRTL